MFHVEFCERNKEGEVVSLCYSVSDPHPDIGDMRASQFARERGFNVVERIPGGVEGDCWIVE